MDFDLSERSEQWRKKLQDFFDQEVLPRHRDWLAHVAQDTDDPALHGRVAAESARRGLVESRPA